MHPPVHMTTAAAWTAILATGHLGSGCRACARFMTDGPTGHLRGIYRDLHLHPEGSPSPHRGDCGEPAGGPDRGDVAAKATEPMAVAVGEAALGQDVPGHSSKRPRLIQQAVHPGRRPLLRKAITTAQAS
jgi:hypothetical protein